MMTETRGAGRLCGLRILVAEDSFMVALSLQQILESLGCTVIGPIPRLDRAIAAAAAAEPLDGAILDVNLAGETIFPVAEQLAERRIPFILATGYDDWVLPEKFRDAPLLNKPFDGGRLERMMDRVFIATAT